MENKLKHNPEPWEYGTLGGIEGYCICARPKEWSWLAQVKSDDNEQNAEANAARIVACVNACAGMEHPENEIQSLKIDIEFFKNENEVLRTMVLESPQRYDYIPMFIFISIIGFWAAIVTGLIILFN